MSVKIKKEGWFVSFFKRFWLYIVAGMLAISIGVTLGVTAAVNQKQGVVDVVKPGNENPKEDNQDPTPIDKDNDQSQDENKENNPKDEKEVNTEPVTFAMPMNEASVLVDFNDSKLVYNPTLDRWESHLYIDLTANDLSVYSVLDGEVESVCYDYLTGYVVTIKHDDGLTSVYASLDNSVNVKEGDNVTKGQKIGQASNLAASSSEYGNHLEFTLLQNRKKIDPNNYLDLQSK